MKECTDGKGFEECEKEVRVAKLPREEKEPRKGRRSSFMLPQSLAFRMGLASLAKFGMLLAFLDWARSE